MNERRQSCCDDIVEAKTSIVTISDDVKSLKHLYKPVYGLCILFIIGTALILGIRADAKELNKSIIEVRKESRDDMSEHQKWESDRLRKLDELTSELIGRYEVIETMLNEIRQDQKEILKWQREHQ